MRVQQLRHTNIMWSRAGLSNVSQIANTNTHITWRMKYQTGLCEAVHPPTPLPLPNTFNPVPEETTCPPQPILAIIRLHLCNVPCTAHTS